MGTSTFCPSSAPGFVVQIFWLGHQVKWTRVFSHVRMSLSFTGACACLLRTARFPIGSHEMYSISISPLLARIDLVPGDARLVIGIALFLYLQRHSTRSITPNTPPTLPQKSDHQLPGFRFQEQGDVTVARAGRKPLNYCRLLTTIPHR